MGYRLCETLDAASASLEPGIKKVALYGDGDAWTHAARQLPGGRWTSKFGDFEDIEHDKLEGFGHVYSQVRHIMRLPAKNTE